MARTGDSRGKARIEATGRTGRGKPMRATAETWPIYCSRAIARSACRAAPAILQAGPGWHASWLGAMLTGCEAARSRRVERSYDKGGS